MMITNMAVKKTSPQNELPNPPKNEGFLAGPFANGGGFPIY